MQKRAACIFLTLLTLSGCGGGGSNTTSSIPPVGGGPPAGLPLLTTERAFSQLSFARPLAMLQAPGDSSRWFVLEKGGVIRVFANDPNAASSDIFLDLSASVDDRGEGGLLGIAFDPDFPTTPEAYVSFTRTGSPLVSYVSRFTSNDAGMTLDAATEEVVLAVPQSATNHNGGDLAFGPDDYLYVAFGDGGGGGDPNENGQNTRNLLASIVRLEVRSAAAYLIPPGNPFATNTACLQGVGPDPCPEIYAWGFRNPWRFSFDTSAGNLWAGDVGQDNWEEIDDVKVGENYGWNDREGPACFDPMTGCADTFADPFASYDHSMGDESVTGGYVYRGTSVAGLAGWYVFGDFVSGRVFGFPVSSAAGVTPDILASTGHSIASFGLASDGELYIVDYGVGTIHRLVAAP